MGRKRKEESEIKRNTTVRFSETERTILFQQADKLGFKDLSEYVRFCTLNTKKTIHVMPAINEKYFSELKKVGVNLNQIAFQLNNRILPKEGELLDVFKEILKQNLLLIEELRLQYKKNSQRFEGGNKE